MSTKKIAVFDSGRMIEAEVDAYRLAQFDSLRTQAAFAADAAEGMAFIVSQLAYTEQQVFARQYVPMQYERLVPISSEAGEWATSVRYEIYDQVGRGKRISGKDRALPKADIAMAEEFMPVYQGGIAYDYSQRELREAAQLRRDLPSAKLAAAIEAYRRHLNAVALTGEAESNLTGLFNNALVPAASAPTGAWGGGSTTEAQVLADFNTLVFKIWENSAYNDWPTHVVLPATAFKYLATTPRATQSDTTLLKFLLENNVARVQGNVQLVIEAATGLETAGSGNTRRAVGYVRNPSHVVLHLPMPLRFLPPQPVGLMVDVPGEYRYSGVNFRYPKSAYYMDGI